MERMKKDEQKGIDHIGKSEKRRKFRYPVRPFYEGSRGGRKYSGKGVSS